MAPAGLQIFVIRSIVIVTWKKIPAGTTDRTQTFEIEGKSDWAIYLSLQKIMAGGGGVANVSKFTFESKP